MQEKNKQIILDFIKDTFKTKRVKNNRNKWSNAIVIPEGYNSKNKNYYYTNNKLNKAIISAEIIDIVCKVFAINQELSKELTLKHLSRIKI